jgi:hypothetical protein
VTPGDRAGERWSHDCSLAGEQSVSVHRAPKWRWRNDFESNIRSKQLERGFVAAGGHVLEEAQRYVSRCIALSARAGHWYFLGNSEQAIC